MAIDSSPMVKVLQLLDPVRIGEINLLFDALSHHPRHKDLTYRVICVMAAKCDYRLQPELYITLGKEFRLVSEMENELKLTRLGRLMLNSATWPPYDQLNKKQIEIIAPELLGHQEIIQNVISVTRLMKWMPKLSLFLYPRSIPISPEQCLALKLLQVTKFVKVDDDYISITKDNYDKLNFLLGNIIPRSEEDLWHSIMKTQLRARAAEEFVVKYERRRLKTAQRNDLCNLVERVSATDVNAGYDIRSFENNGNLRYIEVKSSTNSHVLFYWSSIERNFALAHRDSYWIYFIPRSQELPKLKYEITLIKDPIAVEGKYINMEPSTYRVSLTTTVESFSRIANGSTWARIIK
jgi:septum formation topological specificity factor MinE